MASSPLSQALLNDLSVVLADDSDGLSRLLLFLAWQQGEGRHQYEQVLTTTLQQKPNMEPLKKMVNMILKDIKTGEQDEKYQKVMADLWNNFLQPNEIGHSEHGQKFDYELMLSDPKLAENLTSFNLLRILSKLPPETHDQLIQTTIHITNNLMGNSMALVVQNGVNKISRYAKSSGGQMVAAGLLAAHLAWEVLTSINRWWRGEISGLRCTKIIVDTTVSVGCGIAGGAGGAMIGTAVFPGIGTVVGGVLGGIAAGEFGKRLSDWLTQKLFGLPKEEALENAYIYLQTPISSSNDAINKSFRTLSLKYHPDKGGSYEDWHKLQLSMAIIKASKGEC